MATLPSHCQTPKCGLHHPWFLFFSFLNPNSSANPVSSALKVDLESDLFSLPPLLTWTKPPFLVWILRMASFVVWLCSCPTSVYSSHTARVTSLMCKSDQVSPVLRTLQRLCSSLMVKNRILPWSSPTAFSLPSLSLPPPPRLAAAHGPPLSFLNMPSTFLPQGLCICCSLHLECPPRARPQGPPLTSFRHLLKCLLTREAFPDESTYNNKFSSLPTLIPSPYHIFLFTVFLPHLEHAFWECMASANLGHYSSLRAESVTLW